MSKWIKFWVDYTPVVISLDSFIITRSKTIERHWGLHEASWVIMTVSESDRVKFHDTLWDMDTETFWWWDFQFSDDIEEIYDKIHIYGVPRWPWYERRFGGWIM